MDGVKVGGLSFNPEMYSFFGGDGLWEWGLSFDPQMYSIFCGGSRNVSSVTFYNWVEGVGGWLLTELGKNSMFWEPLWLFNIFDLNG